MKRVFTGEIVQKQGETVELSGWVLNRRDHGKLIFIDLRDWQGTAQVVFTPQAKEAYAAAQELRPEWVVSLKGIVQARPANMVNSQIATGAVEIAAADLRVLSKAKTVPFPIDTSGYEISEEKRLQYRYLDLRRPRLRRNLAMRSKALQFIREFLLHEEFIEIETPLLTKSTPEGARDFVVPSRLYPGTFYALPQSPQQYKQLLQVAGFERYFQIARCLRDEDPRADRQPEFTQLDMEMSFVEREDVMELTERLLIALARQLYPEKTIQQIPFPRLSYQEAMARYNTDRPDIRKDKENVNLLAFCWVVDFPFFSAEGGPASGGETKWTFTHNPFSAPKPEHVADLMAKKNIESILTTQYDVVLNGSEIGGGSIRNHAPEALEKVFEVMGFEKESVVKNFGHMLEAFSYGAPPHGGIAWGFDRLCAILQQEISIREVIAFPKTGDSRDLMMESPSELLPEQIRELHIRVEAPKKNE